MLIQLKLIFSLYIEAFREGGGVVGLETNWHYAGFSILSIEFLNKYFMSIFKTNFLFFPNPAKRCIYPLPPINCNAFFSFPLLHLHLSVSFNRFNDCLACVYMILVMAMKKKHLEFISQFSFYLMKNLLLVFVYNFKAFEFFFLHLR